MMSLCVPVVHAGEFAMAVTSHVNMALGYIVFIYCFSLNRFWGLQRRVSVESIAIAGEPGEPDYWDDMKC